MGNGPNDLATLRESNQIVTILKFAVVGNLFTRKRNLIIQIGEVRTQKVFFKVVANLDGRYVDARQLFLQFLDDEIDGSISGISHSMVEDYWSVCLIHILTLKGV